MGQPPLILFSDKTIKNGFIPALRAGPPQAAAEKVWTA